MKCLKNNINVPTFNGIIHHQALYSKSLNILSTIEICITIINKIRGAHNTLSHRKFSAFLKYLKAQFNDLVMYTEVR